MPPTSAHVSISPAFAARWTPLVTELAHIGVGASADADVALVTPGEPTKAAQHITLTPARRARVVHHPRPGCIAEIAWADADVRFAAALIAALLRGPATPTAVDPRSCALLAMAARAAPRDITVLIGGPTGTGKEVVARYIHDLSARRDCPLVAVNCAALPEAMLEALLFGHERGAFTGAAGAARGLFRAADGGTLLLDEIAELPLGLQAKLLRTLQEREVLPIGATTPVPVNVRIVAAANRDLASEVAAGRFRSDLYYRLAVFPVATLPLAARRADIVPLVATLLLRASDQDFAWPTSSALAKLAAHDWPGNVRELDNVLRRAAIFASDDQIDAADIVFDAAPEQAVDRQAPVSGAPMLGGLVRERESAAIRAVLADCAGRRTEAAARLGISERTLRYKLAAMAAALGPVPGSYAPSSTPTVQ
jgi:two-component system, response regulator FlrC